MQVIPHSRPTLELEDIERVSAQLRSGMIAEGALAVAVEGRLARRWGAATATVTGSGTQALALALAALGVDRSSEVLCPDYVCPEVLAAIEARGARPVLVDIGEDYLPSRSSLAQAIGPRTAAIVLPLLFGAYTPTNKLRDLGVPLIADCAQFFPGEGAVAPLDVDLVVLSFEGTKMLTSGEGGAVLAHDAALGARVAACKRLDGPYKLNLYPLSDLQAALLDAQLDRVDEFIERRRRIAERYRAGLRLASSVVAPGWQATYSCFFRYPLRVADAPEALLPLLIKSCGERGVAVRRPVDALLHRLRACAADFPGAEQAWRETLSLPIYPSLSEQEQSVVIDVVNATFAACGLGD
jgi:UDP-4-amino-4-deoxy-L-arabinose-oxoglutarate aminotransferase